MKLSFKVVDQNDEPLNGFTIKLTKNDTQIIEINDEEDEIYFPPHTHFTTVTVQKEGYSLVTDVTHGIMVDERQSQNTFSFKMSIESVSAS